MPGSHPANMPLAGLTIVEMGHSVAAPFAGVALADLGATLVKIENPKHGDDTRTWGPPYWHGISTVFLSLNRNKHSAAIDLKDDVQRDALKTFITTKADVVFQNMRPGLVKTLGLDAATLRAANPKLIYCNMHAFGKVGPMSNRPGYDPLMQAFGGIMSVTGEEGRPPVRVGPSIVDVGTGMWAVIGILSALHRRDVTGEGCEVDTSLFETALNWMAQSAVGYLAEGRAPKRQGSERPSLVPYGVFRAADHEILIAVGNDNLFRRLVKALDKPEWLDDVRFATNPERVKNRPIVNAAVQEVIGQYKRDDLLALLDANDVPCAPIQSLDQVMAHPQTQALGMTQPTHDGRFTLMGLPLSFDGQRTPHRYDPPELGTGTNLILEK